MIRSSLTGAVAAIALFAAAPVSAATIVGSAAVSLVGVDSSTPTIGVGTTFSNTLFSAVGSAMGDMAPTAGITFLTDDLTASLGSPVSFTSAFGTFAGTVSLVAATGPVDSRVVDIYAVGLFTPAGVLSAFDAGPMSLTASFTQTGGAGSAVSGSYTLSSPPAPPRIAEPATLALLGAGLLGLAAVRRRKA
jgi:uncharacterized membrane protein